jgi:hypothetical protein
VFLLPLFSTALFIIASIDFHPRYYIASLPATLLWLIIITQFLMNRIHPRVGMLAVGVVMFIGIVLSISSIHQIQTTRAYQHDDFAGLADYYATLPETAVILIPFDVERALQDYYADVAPIRARFVTIPIYSHEQTALNIINGLVAEGVTHLEFLTWYQLPADVRGMYPCLLAVASDFIGEQQFFYGLSTQTYQLSQPIQFTRLAMNPRYTYFELREAAYATSSRGTCVKSRWALKTPFDEDLAVTTALSTPFDERIADDDASIAREDSAGTSRWSDRDSGTAYNLLQLPEGAPLINYNLHVAVYSPSHPSGFDILDEAGNPMGIETRLADAIYTEGCAFTSQPVAPSLVSDRITVQTGVPFVVTVVVPANSRYIQLGGDGYGYDFPIPTSDRATLAWAQFTIPPNSGAGVATLMVDGVQIADFAVEDLARVFTPPTTPFTDDVHFIGVGRLVGYDAPATIPPNETFAVQLVWRADAQANPITAYTVFVQLLDENGRVVAQSDAQPSNWERPTTSWIEGEYITDTHILNFNTDYVGAGRLIVGFYDATDNFRRVLTDEGVDFAELGMDVRVAMP